MVKCLPELSIFTVFLTNRNFIYKIRRSKVTDYAALSIVQWQMLYLNLAFKYALLIRLHI